MSKVKRQLKKISRKALFCLGLAVLALVAAMGLKIAQAAWEEPISAAPGDNVYGMINVGANNQTKLGRLLIDPNANPYKPTNELGLTYPLEVRGTSATTAFSASISNNLTVVGNLVVDTNTLYLDSYKNAVGIGMAPDDLTYKLSIAGGGTGLSVGKQSPVSGVGISITGKSDTDTALFGQSQSTLFGTNGVVAGVGATGSINGIAIDTTYMYVVGTDDSGKWRLEKRFLSNGALEPAFDGDGVVLADISSKNPYAIAIDSTYMYVIGNDDSNNWRLEKRFLSNGALEPAFDGDGVVDGLASSNTAVDIAIDLTSGYMYVVGTSDAPTKWRIEKRQLSNGSLCTDANPCGGEGFGDGDGNNGDGVIDGALTANYMDDFGIAIDSTYMYVVGENNGPDWRLEKRFLSNGALEPAFDGDGVVDGVASGNYASDIAIDSTYMYVVGENNGPDWRIEKRFLSNGALEPAFDGDGVVDGDSSSRVAKAIAIDSTYMYVTGYTAAPNDWRMEKRLLSNGNLCTAAKCGIEFGVGGVVIGDISSFYAQDIVIDSYYMFVVGNSDSVDSRLEKRSLISGSLATAVPGVYGEGTTGPGIYGSNNSSGTGVYGTSTGTYGVYGKSGSTTNAAVYGEVSNQGNVTSWAGYFEGRLQATSEVVGNKFLPTSLQNSLMPYVSGMKIGDYTADTAPMNLAFDGTHIWTANTGATTISKIRASDGMKISDKNIVSAPLDIIFDGQFVWVSYNSAFAGKISKINPVDGSIMPSSTYNVGINPNNIIFSFDGTNSYIWASASSNNNVVRTKISDGVQCTYSTGLSNPQGLAFDGEYVWVADTGGNNILKIKFDAAPACTPTVQIISDSNIISPYRIIFDGTYLWVTNNNASATNNIVKIKPSDGTIVATYSTGIARAYDLAFDGTYLWVTHESSTKLVRMRASDGFTDTNNQYEIGADARGIIFDSTYLWLGRNSGNTITKLYSGTGWGYPDLSAYLILQGSTVVAQTGSFNISGTGIIGSNLTVADDIDAPYNVWGGLGDSQKAFGYGCKGGEFVKGVVISNANSAKTKWTDNGELISSATNDQVRVKSASDGEGGAIFVWEDLRTGNRDIYAQRVDSNGNRLWENGPGDYNGIPIATTANSETSPDIVADGYGGVYLTWTGGTSGAETIFVQRVNKNGQKLWGAIGIEIDPIVPGPGFNPKVMRSSDDYMILVFNTWKTPLETIGDEILALKFDKNGNIPPGTTWAANPQGVYVIQKEYDQNMFVVTSDQAGGVIVSWDDNRSVNPGIYTQRLNTNGDKVWGSDGVLVNSSAGGIYSHIISDGVGGAIIVWNNNLTANIYSQRFNGNGQKLWASDVVISSFTGSWTPKIISDESGGVIVTWSDSRNGNSDVYAQRVNTAGNLLWNSNGVPISVVAGSGQSVNYGVAGVDKNIMVSDGRGGAIIVWRDFRNGEEDVYTQRVDKDGQVRWDLNGVPITLTTGSQYIFPVVVSDEAGGGIIAWDEYPYGFKDIYAQKIDDASALLCRPL